ncbi:MAG: aminodeoxychorismate synthase component I [Chloroflexi bacterium]|nr:aminodeoxychorismate synthase component I [Chloroflexota bacterium]
MQENEVLLKHNDDWLHFTNPQRVICAERLDEVHNALQEGERLVEEKGWHAAGFVSYEAAPAFDSALRVLSDGNFPLLWFGLYPEPRVLQTSEVFKDLGGLRILNWQPSVERENYNAAIEKVKDYIARGRTYQVNYTMRLKTDFITDSRTGTDEESWRLFLHLARSQNKYAAYIDTGRYAICSASPELFFHLNGNRIYSRPMKGTAKRGRTTLEDREQADWLKASLKNRAENVMIVDMIRNDLGRIAQTGSVHVPDLFTIEKYPTLFQMTSTVQAKTEASLTEIFSALFPCASITGAPKVSTMDIIAELESTPRKLYTGSIGFIAPNRRAQFNVAIRTAIIDRETQSAEYGVGGGIIWDSTSADEYSEALLKARVLTESPRPFELIETMLWTPDEGFLLREKHLARMQDSADYFDFPFSVEKLDAYLDQLAARFTSPQRVRILLGRSGQLQSEAKDFQSQEKIFKVRLAVKPVNSQNVFLFHKTTRREMYPPVPADCDDLLLWNENDELTEFTIGNLVVELDGKLFTPPISCGLLAGTFRSHLLETGQVSERVIHRDELGKCAKVFLVNSVRKWVEVKIEN